MQGEARQAKLFLAKSHGKILKLTIIFDFTAIPVVGI